MKTKFYVLATLAGLTAISSTIACKSDDSSETPPVVTINMPSAGVTCAGTLDGGPCRASDGAKYVAVVYLNASEQPAYFGVSVLGNPNCVDSTGCEQNPAVTHMFDVTGASPVLTSTMAEGTYSVLAWIGAPPSDTYGGFSPVPSAELFQYLATSSRVTCVPSGANGPMLITEEVNDIDLSTCIANP